MSSVVISGDTSGAITLSAPAVSGTNTATLPAATGTVMVSGNMPAFSAYQSSAQSITGSYTKVQCQTEEFDTANCYDNSTNYRFTPNVAGYYQVNGCWTAASAGSNVAIAIYKNGSDFKRGENIQAAAAIVIVSALIYLNGSTDYIELYVASSLTQNGATGANFIYFQAAMIRGA